MVCLGLEPGVAGWQTQTNPLCYGRIPSVIMFVMKTIVALSKDGKLTIICLSFQYFRSRKSSQKMFLLGQYYKMVTIVNYNSRYRNAETCIVSNLLQDTLLIRSVTCTTINQLRPNLKYDLTAVRGCSAEIITTTVTVRGLLKHIFGGQRINLTKV